MLTVVRQKQRRYIIRSETFSHAVKLAEPQRMASFHDRTGVDLEARGRPYTTCVHQICTDNGLPTLDAYL